MSKKTNKPNSDERRNSNSTNRTNSGVRSGSGNSNRGTKKYYNDPSWIDLNPELTKGAGNLGFYNKMGVSYKFGADANGDILLKEPSLLALYYYPTIGVAKSNTDPSNIIGDQIMTYLRTKISGSRTYDAQDVVMHLLRVSSVLEFLSNGWRAYQMARSYELWDLNSPKDFIDAMGFQYDDIMNNMSVFYDELYTRTISMSRFHFLDNIKLLNRHIALASEIFKDSDSDKAQKYMFVPAGFYMFHNATKDADPYLAWNNFAINNNRHTRKEYFDNLDAMISSMIKDEDFWVIDGDLAKAYDNFYYITAPGRDEVKYPVYNKDMQTQLENATIFNGSVVNGDITQKQAFGRIACEPKVSAQQDLTMRYHITNFHWKDVTPLEMCYASQFSLIPSKATYQQASNDFIFEFDQVGSEILLQARMYFGNSESMILISDLTLPGNEGTDQESFLNTCQWIGRWMAFDWHPTVYLWYQYGPGGPKFGSPLVDYDNWRITTKDELNRIHDAALFSLWGVPVKNS